MTGEARGDAARSGPRRGGAAALVLVGLFALAELPFAAFLADDLIQLGNLEGVLPSSRWTGPLDLYAISDGVAAHVRAMQDVGAFPWFFGGDFAMRFLRPLSSALLALDHAIWGLWPIGYHLQTACWLALLVAAVAAIARSAVPSLARLAPLVFALSAVHASLFWTATRHVAIAGALGMVALAAHLRWRQAGSRAARRLSIAGLALALAASEAAIAAFAYLVAFEALGARDAWRARVRAVAPALVLVAAYLAAYLGLGFGAAGGGYAGGGQGPIALLADVAARWVFLVGTLVAGGGTDLWVLRPDLRRELTVVAAGLAIAAALLLRATWSAAPSPDAAPEDERRGVLWLVAGALASALPFAIAPVGARCLVIPMVGGSVAIAFVLRTWWVAPRPRPWMATAGCLVLAALHLALAPIGRIATPVAMRHALHDDLAAAMRDVDLDPAPLVGRDVVVLRAPSFIVGLHSFFFRALHRMPLPRSWRTLSWAPCRHRFTRTGPDTLELDLAGCEIDAPALDAGDAIELDGLRALVLERGERGPKRVRFAFDRTLDDPSLRFLAWQDGRLRPVAPPPVGGTVAP